MQQIRQPIVSILGHVDSGKTSLLDRIRGSVVAKGEAGGITQHIGASEIPSDSLKKTCGQLLQKMKIDLTIPGLLFIDTPGHEAFTTLRKRGGSIADLAVLVVDIIEGLQPQTEESILFLKEFKTPFIVALNKIDRIMGWVPEPSKSFLDSYNEQANDVQQRFEDKFYELVGQFGSKNFNTERYDRVTDFTKQISIVPVSAATGEGIPDLLMMLVGLAQKYLKDQIKFESDKGRGSILEVKEHKGLGLSMDVILYNGEIKKGDYLVVGGKEIVVTKVKSLMKTEPMKEMRVEKKFIPVDSVVAASGVRISAPGIENVVPGSSIITFSSEKLIDQAKEELKEEIQEIEIHTEAEGSIVKTDTLGSLEAMIKILSEKQIPIRKAEVGAVTKQDILEIKNQKEPLLFAFNVSMSEEVEKLAKDSKVTVLSSNIIYRLIEGYDKWVADKKKREEEKLLEEVIRPAKIKILPGCIFRQSDPAVFGVEVLAGTIKPDYRLKRKTKTVGKIKEVQVQSKNVKEAKAGDRAAISMEDVVVGKHVNEGDILEVVVGMKDILILNKVKGKLRDDEKQLLEELENREK